MRLLREVKNLLKREIELNGRVNVWLGVKDGMHQGCVMAPWLIHVLMNGAVKGWQAKLLKIYYGKRMARF